MSPAHVLEPTYEAIKRHLMAGDWPMGARLEAARLAADLGVSITPVRDSLNRLAGERLVDTSPGEGFRVATLSEQGLRELLDFNLLLLLGAVGVGAAPLTMPAAAEMDHASATASLFLAIADVAGNGAVVAAVRTVNERLQPIRHFDEDIVTDAAAELVALRASFSSEHWARNARHLLTRYHVVRKLEAGRYLGMMAGKGKA
jgi:DNA-binding GntR family transcriptional regulator